MDIGWPWGPHLPKTTKISSWSPSRVNAVFFPHNKFLPTLPRWRHGTPPLPPQGTTKHFLTPLKMHKEKFPRHGKFFCVYTQKNLTKNRHNRKFRNRGGGNTPTPTGLPSSLAPPLCNDEKEALPTTPEFTHKKFLSKRNAEICPKRSEETKQNKTVSAKQVCKWPATLQVDVDSMLITGTSAACLKSGVICQKLLKITFNREAILFEMWNQ